MLLQVHRLHLQAGQLLQPFNLHHVGASLLEGGAVLIKLYGFSTVHLLQAAILSLGPLQTADYQEIL